MRYLSYILFTFILGVTVLHAKDSVVKDNSSLQAADAKELVPVSDKKPYNATRLIEDLTKIVSSHYNLEGEWQLATEREWENTDSRANIWQLAISEFPAQPSSLIVLHYRLIGDGNVVSQGSLLVKASLMRSAWVSRQPIIAHTIFETNTLEPRKVDAFRLRDAVASSVGDQSYAFNRDLPADTVITWHDISRRPLVKRGDIVEVVASEGLLSVSMKALAMSTGVRGDLVVVRNLETSKEISGIVIADNKVEIHF
jgi:flagellar basal body P-ring formation protein FlgA